MMDLYTKLKSLCDDLYKRRLNDSGNSPMNVSSNSNHDSGIQTGTLSCIDEINYLLCDIQELIKSEFMVRKRRDDSILNKWKQSPITAMHHLPGIQQGAS